MKKVNYRDRCYRYYTSSHFSEVHSLSERELEFVSNVYRKRFRAFLPRDKDAAILDVACGCGHFLYFLERAGYRNVLGVDLSEEQVSAAQGLGVKKVMQGDMFELLEERSGYYQMIVGNDIIEHLTKDEILLFLDLVYGALKVGGVALISTLNAGSLFGASLVYGDYTHETGFTPESLSQILRVCRFTNVEIVGELPVIHDFRSFIRSVLWTLVKCIIRSYLLIENGFGRGMWKRHYVLEPRMFAVARKS